MSTSYKDFVGDVRIMLQRNPPATAAEILQYLTNNDVRPDVRDDIIATAKKEEPQA